MTREQAFKDIKKAMKLLKITLIEEKQRGERSTSNTSLFLRDVVKDALGIIYTPEYIRLLCSGTYYAGTPKVMQVILKELNLDYNKYVEFLERD